jgi:RimJ/RimL family protein N-acetyltransferase
VRVRSLTRADVEAALDLFAAVAGEGRWLASEGPIDRREVAARWQDLVATGEGALVLAEDGDGRPPVGLAAIVGRQEPELGMLVAAGRRGEGIGEALLVACLAVARSRGARRVILHVFPHNGAALALYRKHGFVELGLVRGGYPRRNGERWDAVRMAKDLGGG